MADEEFALVSRGVVDIALETVTGWIANDQNEYDSARELLYSGNLPLSLTFGEWDVFIKIVPQDRLLPINGIFLPDGVTMKKEYEYPWQEVWSKLARVNVGTIILDFLDEDADIRPGGKEEDYFPNRKISDLSELLRLPEVTPNLLYEEIAQAGAIDTFFTVYGESTVNINLAPRSVLSVLDADIGPNVVDSILTYRAGANITNAKDLLKIPGFPVTATARLNDIIGYKSNYFLVEMRAEHGYRERNFSVMVKRSGGTCQIVNWRE